MKRSTIMLVLTLGFISGIALRSFFEIGILICFFVSVTAVMLAVVWYRNKTIFVLALGMGLLAVGMWYVDKTIAGSLHFEDSSMAISGEGTIASDPRMQEGYQQVVVNMPLGGVRTNIKMNAPVEKIYRTGDLVKISCIAQPVGILENKDYALSLAKDDIRYVCKGGKIEMMASNGKSTLRGFLARISYAFRDSFKSALPQPEATLGYGIIFGGGSGFSKEVQSWFSTTGITHIVAVSGYNVTIIADYLIILGILCGLWRRQAIVFALVAIALFVIMIGLPASAVRAGIMAGVLFWGMRNGRLAQSVGAVLLSGAVMLVLNPLLLRWDIGFQLSFAAMFGIVLVPPLWQPYVHGKFFGSKAVELVLTTLSAQIFVAPIIAFHFNTVSLISLFANMLVLPLVPLAMGMVFVFACVHMFVPLLAAPFAWVSYALLHYMMSVAKILSHVSWASLQVDGFGGWLVVVYYSVLLAALKVATRILKPGIKSVEVEIVSK